MPLRVSCRCCAVPGRPKARLRRGGPRGRLLKRWLRRGSARFATGAADARALVRDEGELRLRHDAGLGGSPSPSPPLSAVARRTEDDRVRRRGAREHPARTWRRWKRRARDAARSRRIWSLTTARVTASTFPTSSPSICSTAAAGKPDSRDVTRIRSSKVDRSPMFNPSRRPRLRSMDAMRRPRNSIGCSRATTADSAMSGSACRSMIFEYGAITFSRTPRSLARSGGMATLQCSSGWDTFVVVTRQGTLPSGSLG